MEGDGTAVEYAGGYSDYITQRKLSRAEPAKEDKSAAKQAKKSTGTSSSTPAKPKSSSKLSYKDQREYDNLPGAMAKLEAEIKTLEDALSDSTLFTKDPTGFQKKVDRLDAARSELEASEERWLELEMLREELGLG
jgi:ATP-binding cassette subfamily F protein uup